MEDIFTLGPLRLSEVQDAAEGCEVLVGPCMGRHYGVGGAW